MTFWVAIWQNAAKRGRLNDEAGCQGCLLMYPPRPAALISSEALNTLRASQRMLLITFTGPQCAICKRLAPMLSTVLNEYADQLDAVKIDVEVFESLALEFAVRSLPTTLLLRGDVELGRIAGFATAGQLRNWISAQIDA
jgi:thioredoxin 2